MIDPIKFRRFLVQLLKLLALLELVTAFSQGAGGNGWERFAVDLIVAGVLYLMWEQIMTGLTARKEMFRKRIETSPQQVNLRDAFIFSLLASDEIFQAIPEDRRRLVVVSYTLITLGLVAGFIKIGPGFMPLVVAGALVFAAVNLMVWIFSQEREARETLHTELKLAHDVQMSLMPREEPSLGCYDIAGISSPAREVGGDFYDYSPLGRSGDLLGIAVLDVSGKGIQAAMSAVYASGAYSSEAKLSGSPAEILTRLNRSVFNHSKRGHFIAFLLAALDQASGTVTFANAGQTRPMLRTDGHLQTLDSVGVHFPLGMREDTVYEGRELQLRPGDMLVMLTDGFTDAMNAKEEQYGLERIERLLVDPSLADVPARQVIEAIRTDVGLFAGDTPQHDDMTIVVIKRKS
ncbi:MAG TPA: PP2C family protein-serine/threonine phosphatase [Bacteroidota bacterium]